MRQLKIVRKITDRTHNIDQYLYEIDKYPLLRPDDEVSLAKQYKQGDEKALETLVNSNLRFVVSVAKQYQNKGMELEDLIGNGNEGLIRAAKTFDETRGFKFISYAVWWIRQSILNSMGNELRAVRLPLNKINQTNKIEKKICELEQKYERQIAEEELSDYISYKEKIPLNELMAIKTHKHSSLDSSINGDEEKTFLNLLDDKSIKQPDNNLDYTESLKKEIDVCLNRFPERDAKIIKMYFGIGMEKSYTLEEIEEKFEFEYSMERIRQIKNDGIKRLKRNTPRKILQKFLG